MQRTSKLTKIMLNLAKNSNSYIEILKKGTKATTVQVNNSTTTYTIKMPSS